MNLLQAGEKGEMWLFKKKLKIVNKQGQSIQELE